MQKVNYLSDVVLDPTDPYFLNYLVDLGVTGNFLKDFEEKFPELRKDLPELLGVSIGYYRSFLGTGNFLPQQQAKRILLIAQLCLHGCEVFDSDDKFMKWFFCKLQILNDNSPIDIIKEKGDFENIHSIVGRIGYGIPS